MNFWQFRCFDCEQSLAIAAHGVCSRCVKHIVQTPYCGGCGSPLLEDSLRCGNCQKDEPKWQRLVRVSAYQPPLSAWIHRFKFQHQYWWDLPLARLLLLAVKRAQRVHQLALPQAILPVPLFYQRHWRRGFNQAELIAAHLAKWLAIPLDCASLERICATQSQRELSAAERRRNLKGAFAYQPALPYQRVAIVDDVVTTGSTLNAICLELKKQGVQEIQVWALCRA